MVPVFGAVERRLELRGELVLTSTRGSPPFGDTPPPLSTSIRATSTPRPFAARHPTFHNASSACLSVPDHDVQEHRPISFCAGRKADPATKRSSQKPWAALGLVGGTAQGELTSCLAGWSTLANYRPRANNNSFDSSWRKIRPKAP